MPQVAVNGLDRLKVRDTVKGGKTATDMTRHGFVLLQNPDPGPLRVGVIEKAVWPNVHRIVQIGGESANIDPRVIRVGSTFRLVRALSIPAAYLIHLS